MKGYWVDVLPTILDLVGVDSLESMSFDGRSQKDVLFGKKTKLEKLISKIVKKRLFNISLSSI